MKNNVVWLDRAKTRQELRPARLIHRMGDYLADVEREKNSSLHVEKIVNRKYIKVGGQKMCYSLRGAINWTSHAKTRYSDEEREIGAAYAEET
eukprot:753406-Karenia_brevis.AAC.1